MGVNIIDRMVFGFTKSNGIRRALEIPMIQDRVEPIFDAGFCDHSSSTRTAHQTVDAESKALQKRRYHVIDVDLSKYLTRYLMPG